MSTLPHPEDGNCFDSADDDDDNDYDIDNNNDNDNGGGAGDRLGLHNTAADAGAGGALGPLSSTADATAADTAARSSEQRKKRGRKPGNPEIQKVKRKAQNRDAQRAFRERKELYIRELEQRVGALEAQAHADAARIRQLTFANSQLQSENSVLRGLLSSNTNHAGGGSVNTPNPATTAAAVAPPTLAAGNLQNPSAASGRYADPTPYQDYALRQHQTVVQPPSSLLSTLRESNAHQPSFSPTPQGDDSATTTLDRSASAVVAGPYLTYDIFAATLAVVVSCFKAVDRLPLYFTLTPPTTPPTREDTPEVWVRTDLPRFLLQSRAGSGALGATTTNPRLQLAVRSLLLAAPVAGPGRHDGCGRVGLGQLRR